jgi:hypothetical protein
MTHMAVHTCTDCHLPVQSEDEVLRSISSQLAPVAFHERCYQLHVPAPRAPADLHPMTASTVTSIR